MAPGSPKPCARQDGAGSQGGVIRLCLCGVRAHANGITPGVGGVKPGLTSATPRPGLTPAMPMPRVTPATSNSGSISSTPGVLPGHPATRQPRCDAGNLLRHQQQATHWHVHARRNGRAGEHRPAIPLHPAEIRTHHQVPSSGPIARSHGQVPLPGPENP